MRVLRPGPGLLLAATSIGGSHLLLAPELGARFGYGLLWLVVVAHLLKYAAFEAGPRYTAMTGEALLAGYARVPGPRAWPLWMGLVDMLIESVGVLAAVIALTASLLRGFFGVGSLPLWGLGVGLTALVLVWTGGYRRLSRITLALMAALVLGTLAVFLATPSLDLTKAGRGLLPGPLPPAAWLLAASVLGWMPTGVGVSIWHSLWLQRSLEREPIGDRRETLRWACADTRRGYLLSLVLALVFVCLGAAVLQPHHVVLADQTEVALTLSSLYGAAFPWMGPVFLMIAFTTMFSTCYAAMDGFPRTLVATLDLLRGKTRCMQPESRKIYRLYLLVATFGGLGVLAAVPDPVRLIQILGALTLLFTPAYAALNHYCVCRLTADPPGLLWRSFSVAGILFFAIAALLLPVILLGAAG